MSLFISCRLREILCAMLLLIWILVSSFVIVLFCRERYSKFARLQVNNLPVIPLFGNLFDSVVKQKHLFRTFDKIYKAFPEDRFVGYYSFVEPMIMLRDPELIKRIGIKDYDYFIDRREQLKGVHERVLSDSLVFMKGEQWKEMRSSLSPAFTSSKIKLMVPFMVEISEQMSRSLRQKINESGDNHIDIDFKEWARRYANDVIALCAFGIKVDSHSGDEEFLTMATDMSNFRTSKVLKFLVFKNIPILRSILDLSVLSKDAHDFFTKVVLDTIEHRKENNIVRNDMIHMLMEAKKGRLTHDSKDKKDDDAGFATVEESDLGKKQYRREWTNSELVSQAMVFLFAGFETVSTVMSFLAFQLAIEPEMQERLYQEIKENDAKNGGKFDYSSIQKLTYLDMFVSEILRMYPPASSVDRSCVQDYNMGRPNKKATKDYIIRKGESVLIPVRCLHHDPKYYPNPSKFDPERFSEENKHKINPVTYIPFGIGPRNCIGSRFALCEVKVMAYQLLQNFELSPCPKSCIPVELADIKFGLKIKGGFWVRVKPRQ